MPWFGGGGKKTGGTPPTTLQTQKTKQIEALRNGNFNVIETIPDVEYRVTTQINGSNITLVITLPPKFPEDKPTVVVEPAVRHAWVDAQRRVIGCPNLMNFTVHSSLCTAVQVIIEEFKIHPPEVSAPIILQQSMFNGTTNPATFQTPGPALPPPYPYGGGAPGYPGYGVPAPMPTLPTVGATGDPPSYSQLQPEEMTTVNSSIDFTPPDVFKAFPELKTLGQTALLEILNEEDKILEMIQKMPQVQAIAEERERISCECADLANENLSKRPTIEELKECVKEKNEEFDRLRQEFERNQEKQLSLQDQFHPSVIQNNLKVAIMEADEESDRIVEDYLNKKLSIDEFQQTFLEKRMLYHSRRAKEEKISQIVYDQGYQ